LIEERFKGDDVIVNTGELGEPLRDGESARPGLNRSRFTLPPQIDHPYLP
jgi:hypothetical protein